MILTAYAGAIYVGFLRTFSTVTQAISAKNPGILAPAYAVNISIYFWLNLFSKGCISVFIFGSTFFQKVVMNHCLALVATAFPTSSGISPLSLRVCDSSLVTSPIIQVIKLFICLMSGFNPFMVNTCSMP